MRLLLGLVLLAGCSTIVGNPVRKPKEVVRSAPLLVVVPSPQGDNITGNIADNAILVGSSIVWTAVATGPRTPVRVEFLIDGVIRTTEFNALYQFNGDPNGRLDTTTLSDGPHTLLLRAVYADNTTATQSITVTVDNLPDPPPPPVFTTLPAGYSYVYIDGGACETGEMEMVLVMAKMPCDPTATPMCEIPHPQFPRVKHGDCFWQSDAASKYATLVRCIDPAGVDTPSAWVGPVNMIAPVPRSQCVRVRN